MLTLRGGPSRLWALLPTGASKILAKTQGNEACRPGQKTICSCRGKSAEEEKDLSSSCHDHCKSRKRVQTSAKSHQAPLRRPRSHVGSYVAGLEPCLWSGHSHPSYPVRTEYFICVANIACWIIFSKQRASDVVHLYEHFIERQRYGRWLLGKHASWLKGDKSRFLTVFFTFLLKLRLWNN